MELSAIVFGPYFTSISTNDSVPNPQLKKICSEVSQILRETRALLVNDPRCSATDNGRFIDMMERYFKQLGWCDTGGVEVPRSLVDEEMLKKLKSLSKECQPLTPRGPDPKWRYMWRIGPRPSTTKFQLNSEPIIPKGFPEWKENMDSCGSKMVPAIELSVLERRGAQTHLRIKKLIPGFKYLVKEWEKSRSESSSWVSAYSNRITESSTGGKTQLESMVDLSFLLGEEETTVSAKISVVPRVNGAAPPLVLDGVDLKLISVKINGNELKKGYFQVGSRHLILTSPPSENFILETVTEILQHKNTSLEGLYMSSGNFCTQCEAEGFRKITFYQDRPDIMAKYTCRIGANKSLYPVLLSNGNLTEQGDLEGGNHFAVCEDLFKKPCYLFALVAGQLESRDDTFTTCTGRKIALKIWNRAQDLPKTEHAMYSLKAAMKWDEDVEGVRET